jgi:tryptophan-rich sensory protein
MAFVFLATFIVNYACAFIPMAANSTYVQWVFEELKKPPWTVPGWFLLMMWVLTTGTNALASSLYVLYAMVNWRERWLAGMPFLLLLAIQCVWVDLFFYWHQWTLLMVLCVLAIVCGALSTVWWWLAINGLVGALMLPFTGWLCYMVALLSYFQSS